MNSSEAVMMKMTFALLLLLVAGNLHAQENWNFLNVGFKFSHSFGPGGGFTPGVEVSYTLAGREIGGGILLSGDVCNGRSKVHIGLEGFTRGVGISIGPTLISEHEKTGIGYTLTVYGGLLVYPYYSYTTAPDSPAYQELGSFFKFPIQMAGRKFSLGG